MTAVIWVLLLPGAALWIWLKAVPGITEPQRAAAALALGVGGSSATFFLWRVAGGDLTTYPLIDAGVWTAVGVAGACRVRRGGTIPVPAPTRGMLALGALAIAFTGLCGMMLVDWIRAHPHGRWDAWALWTLKAKFLATPSEEWRNAFDVVLTWSHPDYPLLLPSAVARAWVLGGSSVAMSIAISLVFLLIAVLTVVASLWASWGAAVASMGLALVAAPTFILLGAAQMADVPLAAYVLLAVTLLAVREPRAAHLALAGAAMGFAAWTKNEGLVTAAVLPSCYVLVRGRRDGFDAARRAAGHLALGLVPILGIVAVFKIALSPGSYLVSGALRPDAPWPEWARIALVVSVMARGAASWGEWPVGSPTWLLAVLVVAPRRPARRLEPAVLAAALYLVVQLAVFCVVYLVTPYDVGWHLRTSWPRLIAQMWPTLVWCVCSTRGAPQESDDSPSVSLARRPAVGWGGAVWLRRRGNRPGIEREQLLRAADPAERVAAD